MLYLVIGKVDSVVEVEPAVEGFVPSSFTVEFAMVSWVVSEEIVVWSILGQGGLAKCGQVQTELLWSKTVPGPHVNLKMVYILISSVSNSTHLLYNINNVTMFEGNLGDNNQIGLYR